MTGLIEGREWKEMRGEGGERRGGEPPCKSLATGSRARHGTEISILMFRNPLSLVARHHHNSITSSFSKVHHCRHHLVADNRTICEKNNVVVESIPAVYYT